MLKYSTTLLALLLSAGPALAQPNCASNGCGGEWTRWLVPNKPAGASFLAACNAHDQCYGGCPVPVDRKELYSCTNRFLQINRRSCCDDAFLLDLLNICRKEIPSKELCRLVTVLYYLAVDAFGGSSFEGVDLKDWIRDKASTNEALPDTLFQQSANIAAAIGTRDLRDQFARIQLRSDGTILVHLEQQTLMASTDTRGGQLNSDKNRQERGNQEVYYGSTFELSGVSPEVESRIRERLGSEALRYVPRQ